jgi:hypothetical protein
MVWWPCNSYQPPPVAAQRLVCVCPGLSASGLEFPCADRMNSSCSRGPPTSGPFSCSAPVFFPSRRSPQAVAGRERGWVTTDHSPCRPAPGQHGRSAGPTLPATPHLQRVFFTRALKPVLGLGRRRPEPKSGRRRHQLVRRHRQGPNLQARPPLQHHCRVSAAIALAAHLTAATSPPFT